MRFLRSIKFKLTFRLVMVLLVPLMIFGVSAYLLLSYDLHRNVDNLLKERYNEIKTTISLSEEPFIVQTKLDETILFFDLNGNLVQQIGQNVPTADTAIKTFSPSGSFITAEASDGQQIRLYSAATSISSQSLIIMVGRPLTEINNVLSTYRTVLLYITLIILLLSGLGGITAARNALKPVDWMTRMVGDIDEKGLKRRIEIETEDELGQLAKTLNGMIGRLDKAFEKQQQFTADASHELRTPLAVIQAESSLSLEKTRNAEEYKKSLETISHEVEFMSSVINKLLFLARADAGAEAHTFKIVDMKNLVSDVASDMEVIAQEKGVKLMTGPLEQTSVRGDAVQLRQLLSNLYQNAIRYTPSGGKITVKVNSHDKKVIIHIEDTGIGIPSEHVPHIFERFYRVDKVLSREEGGSGLGLAIAKVIATVHGGTIEVESQVRKGSTFKVILPAAG
jgi:heavy metal sensor kinase